MADSTPSIIAIAFAAKVLRLIRSMRLIRLMHLIRLVYQLIRLDLLCSSARNITCPPWLSPSLRFPKAASVNKTLKW